MVILSSAEFQKGLRTLPFLSENSWIRIESGNQKAIIHQIGADGSCIFQFDVIPHGRKYFYKKIPDETFAEWQEEAFAELKAIFLLTRI